MKIKLGCVLLAAGTGSRFGSDKLYADFKGRPMIEYALKLADCSKFSDVAVVSGNDLILNKAAQYGFKTIKNISPEKGQSLSVKLGLESLEDCTHAMFMVSDQPLLTKKSLEKAISEASNHPKAIVSLSSCGQRGNPCIFPSDLFSELMTLEGDCGGGKVISMHPSRLLLVDVPKRELTDIDDVNTLYALSSSIHPKIDVRFFTKSKAFGPGIYRILLLTRETGSLRSAAEEMGMSYSKAFNAVKSCEDALGEKLLSRRIGGKAGGGSELTDYSKEIILFYEEYIKRLNDLGDNLFLEMLKERKI